MIYFVALSALVYQLTGSSLAVAGALMSMTLPTLLLAPVSGFLIDRWPRRALLVSACVLRGLSISLIPLVEQLEWIYAVALVSAVIGQFIGPIINASLPDLVPKEELFKANSWTGLLYRTIQIVGSAAGGTLLVAIGTLPTFWVTTACFWAFAALALVLPDKRIESQHSQIAAIIPAFFSEFAGAAKFLGKHRLVLFAFLVFMITSLTGASFNTLALEFTHEYLGSDEQGFGLLLAARGAGALIGMAVLVLLGSRTTPVKVMLYSLAGSGLMFVFLAGARSLAAAALWLLLEGLISTGFSVAARTLQQEHLPSELRGKVLGLSMAMSQGVYVLAAGVAGILATQTALPLIFVAAGSILMIFALLYPLITQSAFSKEAKGND